MMPRRADAGVVLGLGASLVVAVVAIGAFAWAAPRFEAPVGFRAYLDAGLGPVSIAVSPPDMATGGPITVTSSLTGFLKGLSGIPDQIIAASVAAEVEALGGSEAVQIQRFLSASVNDDGTTASLISVMLVSDGGLHKAAELSSNGLALWYSPPLVELPADVTPGSTWEGSGSVNGIASYETVGSIEESETPGCIVAATTTLIIIDASAPIEFDLRTTWCRGLGSTSSIDVDSGRTASVVPDLAPQALPDAEPAATPAYSNPVSLPFLSPSILLPAQVFGDMLVVVNSATADIVAVPLNPPSTDTSDSGVDPATSLPVAWMQHPGGAVLGVASDGQAVFVTTTDRKVVSFDRAGGLRWISATPDVAAGSPVVTGDLLVVATLDGSVHALNRLTGERVWSRTMSDAVVADPVATGTRVVVADIAGQVTAFDAAGTGDVVWSAEVGPVTGPLSSLPDGSVLVGDDAGSVHRLGADGSALWSGVLAGPISGPARVIDRVVVVPTTSGLQGLGLDDGHEVWRNDEWPGAQVWSQSSGVAVTQGDRFVTVGADGVMSPVASLAEPDGEPVTDAQLVTFSGQSFVLTGGGGLLPWPGAP